MSDLEWQRFEEEERNKFFNQQCPFPKYDAWCQSKQYQYEKNRFQYEQDRDKAELAWNQNYKARRDEFERQLNQKKEKYLANARLIASLKEENKMLKQSNQELKEENQDYKEEIQDYKEEIQALKSSIQKIKAILFCLESFDE